MHANVGDRLIVEGPHVGDVRREGIITQVKRDDHTPPYTVRWQDGHEGLIFPGPDAKILPPTR